MKTYDLIISGAGFAGLSAAQAAASRGVHTLVLESKPHPGHNMHTTGLLVKEAADLLDVPRSLVKKIHSVRMYSPSLQFMDLSSPGYYFLATDVEKLMEWMTHNTISAGANIRFSEPLINIDIKQSQVDLRRGKLGYKYLIGSDGARSKVARCAQLGQNKKHLIGYEAVYTGITGISEDHMHVFIDNDIAKGYIAWVLPGVGVTQIGIATRDGIATRQHHSLALSRFKNKISGLFDFSRAHCVSNRGGLIPCGGVVKSFARENIMLIGDAAGMVSPLTAGGIHPALQIGRMAGISVADYLLDNGELPQTEIKRHLPNYFFKQQMRTVADRFMPGNNMIDVMFSNKIFRKISKMIFFHNRGLLSWRTWQKMLAEA